MTSFVKMHGLGNDFVVVDRRAQGTPVDRTVAVAWCDRHRGIGADGVLSLVPSQVAPFGMHVTNADGSVAEMCGNGLRCVVRYAVDARLLPADGGWVETGRGRLRCDVEHDGQIRVDMGEPEIGPSFALAGLEWISVSMGNPHAVTFVTGDRPVEAWARDIGPGIETHERFPNRINVELARLTAPDAIDLAVWERGAGLTQACGTGACATVVAAVITGRAQAGDAVRVRLPGGVLLVRPEANLSRVWMTGPAVYVFSGEVEGVLG